MEFELNTEFIIDEEGEELEKNVYDIKYNIKLLKTDSRKAVIYDKEFKMHFEKPSGMRYVYEIETKDVNLALTKRLKKSEDFMRRLFYRYDWMQLHVNGDGQIIDILNKESLKISWSKLKNVIANDYKGPVAANYLYRIDKAFIKDGNEPVRSLNQYLHFALLFPRIPFDHNKDWANKRMLKPSEYEYVKFEENIVFDKTENNIRHYRISGSSRQDCKAEIIRYEGITYVPANDIFPEQTNLAIEYIHEARKIRWNFTLKRVETNN